MEKPDYKHGKFTILKSEIDTDDFDRRDYEAWCEDNDMEPGDEEDFFDWCAEETQNNYDADMDNINTCEEYNVPVVVTGSLGLWSGRPEIRPERYESVAEAIIDCMDRSDSHDVYAEFDDGVILLDCYHHDGCNCFTIRALSEKGKRKQGTDYKEHDFKRLPYLYAIGI